MRGRAVTVLLSVDPCGTTDRDEEIAALTGGHQVVVASDAIAFDVLIALGADPVDARNGIRWSHGVDPEVLDSTEVPSLRVGRTRRR